MSAKEEFDYMLKVVIVGDPGVGKSSLVVRFCDDKFSDTQTSTIGVDFKVKYMTVSDKRVKLMIWDTAGQERFRTLTNSYYRGAHGVILMYDATNRRSFSNLTYWLTQIRENSTNPSLVRLLLGNKLDVPTTKLQVSRSEGEIFSINNSMLFEETSSKTGFRIEKCFEELVSEILSKPDHLVSNTDASLRPLANAVGKCYAC